MTDEEVEVVELGRRGRQAVEFWRRNPMLPISYVNARTGEIDVEGMQRACLLLQRVDLDPLDALGDTFNIKGNIGFKADLQRILIVRMPGYDFEFLEIDADHVTARIQTPTGWKPPLTKRIDDTDLQAYAKQNEKNYRDKPNRMLEARVTTELVDLYAKGVIRGIVKAAQAEDLYMEGDESGGTGPNAAGASGPAGPPPRSTAPDGSSIPEPLREPEVDDDLRADLQTRIANLEPDTLADLTAVAKSLRLPPLRTPRFTLAHGALLDRLITEALERSQQVPADTYDDSPEAYETEPGAERYDPDDGLPF